MTVRIGSQVLRGELNNSQDNMVVGWIELLDDHRIELKLTGNMGGQLDGSCLGFQTKQIAADSHDETTSSLEPRQAGQVGDILFVERRVARCSAGEFAQLVARGESPPVDIKPCLYMEWFGPNGRVVVEMVDPVLDVGGRRIRAEQLPPDSDVDEGPEIISFLDSETCGVDPPGDQAGDDPCSLLPENLGEQLNAAIDQNPQEKAVGSDENEAVSLQQGRRSWDEVLPGIDPKIKKMYEQWDEIIYGENHVPVATLFDPPLKLPPVDTVSAEQATELVDQILTELHKFAVVLEVCDHFSDLECYRLLVNEILPDAQISPLQPESGFVTHYATWDWCAKCQDEFDVGTC